MTTHDLKIAIRRKAMQFEQVCNRRPTILFLGVLESSVFNDLMNDEAGRYLSRSNYIGGEPVFWRGILQDLMLSTFQHEHPEGFDPWLTNRERKIAATVIQWLGTNCGRSFLFEASKRMGRTHFPFTEKQ